MDRISRRRFLGMLATTLTVSLIPVQLSQMHRVDAQGRTVIIIGAGMAGLSAGNMLKNSGYRVVVLEARDRIGGRIWTDRSLQGLPLDMGASWIHGIRDNPVHQLAQDYGIETQMTDADNSIFYRPDGVALPDEELSELYTYFEALIEEVYDAGEALENDVSLGSLIHQTLDSWDLSETERLSMLAMVNSAIEHEYAADIDDLSVWWWDNDSSFEGHDVLFPGGYDQIVTRLAEELDIRLNEVVTEIVYDNADGVTINTTQGSLTGDFALVTVPLGVLKSDTIRFQPPLPQAKQNAINKMGMGLLNKVYLHFPHVFWDEQAEWIVYMSENVGEWSDMLNIYAYTKEPILLLFVVAEFAQKVEDMNDEEIITQAMSMLRKIYGEDIPEPDNSLISRWGKDPFARGSYSSFYVGATPIDQKALAENLNDVLFFAGEATSEYIGTVHGALLSGRRAAAEIRRIT